MADSKLVLKMCPPTNIRKKNALFTTKIIGRCIGDKFLFFVTPVTTFASGV
jgi:hypothetical protein